MIMNSIIRQMCNLNLTTALEKLSEVFMRNNWRCCLIAVGLPLLMQVLSSRVCSSTFENAVFERLNVGECGLWLNSTSTKNTLVNLEMVTCVCPTHFDFRTLRQFGVVGNVWMTWKLFSVDDTRHSSILYRAASVSGEKTLAQGWLNIDQILTLLLGCY